MGLAMLDLPPIQLHASTQTDIRTPEKAKFLQDAGLSQIVLARELTLPQISAIRDVIDTERTVIEFFVQVLVLKNFLQLVFQVLLTVTKTGIVITNI